MMQFLNSPQILKTMKLKFIIAILLTITLLSCQKICTCPKTVKISNNTAYSFDLFILDPYGFYWPNGRVRPFELIESNVPCYSGRPANFLVAIDTISRIEKVLEPCGKCFTIEN